MEDLSGIQTKLYHIWALLFSDTICNTSHRPMCRTFCSFPSLSLGLLSNQHSSSVQLKMQSESFHQWLKFRGTRLADLLSKEILFHKTLIFQNQVQNKMAKFIGCIVLQYLLLLRQIFNSCMFEGFFSVTFQKSITRKLECEPVMHWLVSVYFLWIKPVPFSSC